MRQQTAAHFVPVRLTLLMLITVLMSGLVSVIAIPAQLVSAAAATTNSDVNLRAGPGEWYDVLAVIPAGSPISIDGDAVDGFSPVSYNGMYGWVGVSFVVADGSGVAPVADPAYQTDPTVTTLETGTVVYDGQTNEAAYDSGRGDRNGNDQGPTTDAPLANPGASAAGDQGIVSIIHEAAAAYGQSPQAMERVARCESNLNPRAVDPSGTYHGLFQFVPSTFAATPYGDQDIYDPWANAHAAAWMWSEGRKGEWVCQ